jgi:adenylate kinase
MANSESEISAMHMPGPILLLGAPGVGKGTQARLLMEAWHVPQISTGDILRDNVARGSELGLIAKALMDRGELVDDGLVNTMVAERLQEGDTHRGYIFDGYPRTLEQARWLDHHFAEAPERMLPLIAVTIRVSDAALLRRLTGRRTCPVCRQIYNIYTQPPAQDGICDVEGAALVQRDDDREEIVVERMKAYEQLTAPVIEHYRAHGRYAEVNGEQDVDRVFADLVAQLGRLRGAQ